MDVPIPVALQTVPRQVLEVCKSADSHRWHQTDDSLLAGVRSRADQMFLASIRLGSLSRYLLSSARTCLWPCNSVGLYHQSLSGIGALSALIHAQMQILGLQGQRLHHVCQQSQQNVRSYYQTAFLLQCRCRLQNWSQIHPLPAITWVASCADLCSN